MPPSIRGVTVKQHNSWKLSSIGLLKIYSRYSICYFTYLMCTRLRNVGTSHMSDIRQMLCLRLESKSDRSANKFTELPSSHCLFVCLSIAILMPFEISLNNNQNYSSYFTGNILQPSLLLLFMEIILPHSENHIKPTKATRRKSVMLKKVVLSKSKVKPSP
jgi:hypothetical protein